MKKTTLQEARNKNPIYEPAEMLASQGIKHC
jgi:hypothetical protein